MIVFNILDNTGCEMSIFFVVGVAKRINKRARRHIREQNTDTNAKRSRGTIWRAGNYGRLPKLLMHCICALHNVSRH